MPTHFIKNGFPKIPVANTRVAAVFWVVYHDFRRLTHNERRFIVYPAMTHDLMERAPQDEYGVEVRLNHETHKIETSRCGYVLSEKGRRYYEKYVFPVLPVGFKSDFPQKRFLKELLRTPRTVESDDDDCD